MLKEVVSLNYNSGVMAAPMAICLIFSSKLIRHGDGQIFKNVYDMQSAKILFSSKLIRHGDEQIFKILYDKQIG